jgi:hypothetical protein
VRSKATNNDKEKETKTKENKNTRTIACAALCLRLYHSCVVTVLGDLYLLAVKGKKRANWVHSSGWLSTRQIGNNKRYD